MDRRPYFRYGSGKWSRALCEVVLSSSVSGSLRQFRVFALPNPPEFSEQWFDASVLVPILIGMDFLGPQGVGMIIDFNDGYSWTSGVMDSSPRILKQSSKGHFVLDWWSFSLINLVFHTTIKFKRQQRVFNLLHMWMSWSCTPWFPLGIFMHMRWNPLQRPNQLRSVDNLSRCALIVSDPRWTLLLRAFVFPIR